MATNSDNPYVGPRTFTTEEGNRFFGRDREARELFSLVVSERLVLFYAQSGAGKSSLLNTRLIPYLREAGFPVLPIGRVSGQLPEGMGEVKNIFIFNLLISLDQSSEDAQQFADLTLQQFLLGLSSDDGLHYVYDASLLDMAIDEVDDEASPYTLIIDQFEEIITTNTDYWENRSDFFRQLDQAMLADPNLWVVLTLREDYIAALDPYADLLEYKMRARFYMQRMGFQAALQAVSEPAKLYGRPFATGVAERLVDNLRQIRGQRGELSLGEFIEPVQLQVVCYQLWEHLKNRDSQEITYQDLTEAGDVNKALALFYEEVVTKAIKETGVSQIVLRNWFAQRLITEAGTRGIVHQGPNTTEGLQNRVVKLLADQFLLRAEIRAGSTWYELVHDSFIDPIQQANQAWFLKQPLLQMAQAWKEAGKPEGGLLTGEQLIEVQTSDWQALGGLVAEFVRSSQTAQRVREQAHRAEDEARKQRELETARQLATEAEARRKEAEARQQIEAQLKQDAEAHAQAQMLNNHKLRGRAMLAIMLGIVAGLFAITAAVFGYSAFKDRNIAQTAEAEAQGERDNAEEARAEAISERDKAEDAEDEAATAEAMAIVERDNVRDALATTKAAKETAEAASTGALEQQTTALAARVTAEAGRQVAINALETQVAQLDEFLAATPSPTLTPTPTRTPRRTSIIPTRVPTQTPTPTPDVTATASYLEAQAQRDAVEATQTAISNPAYTGRLAIPLKFGAQHRIYITGFDGQGINGKTAASIPGKQPEFSPDGRFLLVNGTISQPTEGIYVADEVGNYLETYLEQSSASWPVWSPEIDTGETLYIEKSLGGNIFLRDLEGNVSEVKINGFPIPARSLIWSDDNQLVFHACQVWQQRDSECGIWVTKAADLDHLNPTRILAGNDAYPMDARHGWLTYMSKKDGDWDVYLIGLAGGEETVKNLTDNDAQDGLSAIGLDGKSVIYLSDEDGGWALWSVVIATGEKERWFHIAPERGDIDTHAWQENRLSWSVAYQPPVSSPDIGNGNGIESQSLPPVTQTPPSTQQVEIPVTDGLEEDADASTQTQQDDDHTSLELNGPASLPISNQQDQQILVNDEFIIIDEDDEVDETANEAEEVPMASEEESPEEENSDELADEDDVLESDTEIEPDADSNEEN